MPRPAKPFRKGNYYYSDIGGRRTKLCHASLGLRKAEETLRKLLRQREQDGGKVYEDLTVAAMFALFLKNVEAERTGHTFDDYQRWLTDFASLHGNRQARDVSRLDAQNYRNDLTRRTWERGKKKGQPYKPKTINHAVIALKRAWNWAIEMELLPGKNPFAKLGLLHTEGRQRTATEGEFQALMAHATDQHFRDVLTAYRFSPSRPKYIRILTWSMVDWDNHQWVIWKTKTIRTQKVKKPHLIPMPPVVEEMLRRRQEVYGHQPYVFLNEDGKPWTKDALCLRMRRCRERAGLGPDENGEELVIYTNRHTFLTEAAETENAFTVQQLGGHEDPRTTGRYVHLKNERVNQAGQKTAERLGAQADRLSLGK
jgi:integrase